MKTCILKTKSFAIVLTIVLSTLAGSAFAQRTWDRGGGNNNWGDPLNWSGDALPTAADAVTFPDNALFTAVTVNVVANCASIQIDGGPTPFTLTINTGITLNVTTSSGGSGLINIGAPTDGAADKVITLATASSVLNAVSITMADVTVAVADNTILNINAGTVNLTGGITMGGAADENELNMTSGTLNIGGDWTGAGNFVHGTGTVNYNGAAQVMKADTYANLIASGSGAKTSAVTVEVKLTIQGTATVGSTVTYSSAELEYNGSAPQTTSVNEFPAALTITTLIINNTSGVTLDAGKTLTGNLELLAGTLTAATNLTMGATSTPVITRNAGSLSGTLQGANDYNVVYEGLSKTTGAELSGSGLADINVDLTNTTDVLTLDQSRTPDDDVTLSNGILDIGANTFNGVGTLDITGGATLRIGGTNSLPTYGSYSISNTTATVEYAGTAQAVAAVPGENYTILILSGSGVKTLAAETIEVRLIMRGTATTAGSTPTYAATAVLEYNGSAAQSSGVEWGAVAGTPHFVEVDNLAGLTLTGTKIISGTGSFTFTNGVVNTGANVLIFNDRAAGSAHNLLTTSETTTSYVIGTVRKIGNDAFIYPVGGTNGFVPLSITGPDNAADAIDVRYVRGAHPNIANVTAPVQKVSACEWWDVVENADAGAGTSITVTLHWNANSPCNSQFYVTNPATIRAARFVGGSWSAEGAATGTGAPSPGIGSVAYAAVSAFVPMTLGTDNLSQNPLPVKFVDVIAYEQGTGVRIDWSNLTESEVVKYVVERSGNSQAFGSVNEQAARSNSGEKETYTSYDASPLMGANFYRVSAIETSGKVIYSKILKVDIGRDDRNITVYPNPVRDRQVNVSFSTRKGQYSLRIMNSAGQEVYSSRINHQGGSMTQTLELPSTVKPGIYNMLISGDDYRATKSFIVQ